MTTLRTDLAIRVEYHRPPRDTAESFRREHERNLFNRIAFRYFQHPAHLEALEKYMAVELLLEGVKLPSFINWK